METTAYSLADQIKEVNYVGTFLGDQIWGDNSDKESETDKGEADAEGAGKSAEAGNASDEEESGFDLLQYFSQALGIAREKPVQVLETVDIEGIAKLILSGKCKNIITMAGAGISTSAGIPDFRSPSSGLYENLGKYNLPDPQAMFEINFFKEHPEPFFDLARQLWPGTFKPTPCHYFLRLLDEKGYLLRHYTQNMDTLERAAGLSVDRIIEAHGSLHSSRCLSCNKKYSKEWMKERVFAEIIPSCTDCAGLVKPDIIFFGEALPSVFYHYLKIDFTRCDLLIVMGTSLVVQPFASITSRVPLTCPRLYINRERTGCGDDPISALMFGGGFLFDSKDNYRDVFWKGDCDDGCFKLADLIGFGDELRSLVKSEHAKLDEENKAEAAKVPQKKSPAT